MKILISACLLGIECKYNGGHNRCEELMKSTDSFVPICPEQLAGLPTPRPPMEIQKDGRVLTVSGEDVTEAMNKGARESLRIAKLFHCERAILKACSPSCGYGEIYDGSFSGKKVSGMGIAAKKLHEFGIEIMTEENLIKGERL